MQVLVIGGGVSGLTTALRLVEAGHDVEIWTEKFYPDTVSSVAAAIWYPYKAAPEAEVVQWSKRGYEVFSQLATQPDTGVKMLAGVEYFKKATPDPTWAAYVQNFRHAPPAELLPGYADAHCFDAPMIEMSLFLAYLQRQLQAAGVLIQQRKVNTLAEGLANFPVVVNCTGLAARELLHDDEMYPIRGQIMRVAKGTLTNFYFDDGDDDAPTYIVPRSEDCILGGVAQADNWSLEPDSATVTDIQARCFRLKPELAALPILEHKVGLRPGRSSIRLELERQPDGKLLVHNYGHGGAGVTVAWGCAEEVTALLAQ